MNFIRHEDKCIYLNTYITIFVLGIVKFQILILTLFSILTLALTLISTLTLTTTDQDHFVLPLNFSYLSNEKRNST